MRKKTDDTLALVSEERGGGRERQGEGEAGTSWFGSNGCPPNYHIADYQPGTRRGHGQNSSLEWLALREVSRRCLAGQRGALSWPG
jgi:hypothetical protein